MGKIKKQYNNITLCKGIYLDNVKQTDRNGDTGISTSLSGSKWYMLPKGRAIFKSYDGSFYKYIKTFRVANELLCQELAKQVGIPCAEYQPATYKNTSGLITYDVTKKGEELINGEVLFSMSGTSSTNYLSNDLNSYIKSLKGMQSKGYKFSLKEEFINLYKIAIFDSLTAQSDRHIQNTFFIINKKDKTLRVAPLIDNELAFNIEYESVTLYYNEIIKKSNINENINHIYKQLEIEDLSSHYHDKYDANLKHIVNIAKSNPILKQVLLQILQDYNLEKAIESVENQGTKLSPFYKKYLNTINKIILSKYKKNLVDKKSTKADNQNKYSDILEY